jgi:hypothetical protein
LSDSFTVTTGPREQPRGFAAAPQSGITAHLLTAEPSSEVVLSLNHGRLVFEVVGNDAPRWFQPTVDALREMLTLRWDWDSYGADPVNDAVIVMAAEVLLQMPLPDNAHPPAVVPGSTGSVQLEWHRGGLDVEIYVGPATTPSGTIYDRRTGQVTDLQSFTRRDLLPVAGMLTRLG